MKEQGSKGERSRQIIIETAIQLISDKGFFETSIQNIAKKCELSQSAVFHHFKDKVLLFEGVLGYVVQKNHAMVSASFLPKDNAKVRLQKHCEENLKWASEFPDEAKIVILLYYISTYDSKMRLFNEKITAIGRERVAEYLYAGIREGFFRADLKVPKTAEVIHQWLVGAILQAVTQNENPNVLSEFRRSLTLILSSYLE